MAKSLEEKIKDLDTEFCGEIRGLSPANIKERLIKLDIYEVELNEAQEEDFDLQSKKEAVKIAKQTYSEPLKAIKLKRAFALKILAEKSK